MCVNSGVGSLAIPSTILKKFSVWLHHIPFPPPCTASLSSLIPPMMALSMPWCPAKLSCSCSWYGDIDYLFLWTVSQFSYNASKEPEFSGYYRLQETLLSCWEQLHWMPCWHCYIIQGVVTWRSQWVMTTGSNSWQENLLPSRCHHCLYLMQIVHTSIISLPQLSLTYIRRNTRWWKYEMMGHFCGIIYHKSSCFQQNVRQSIKAVMIDAVMNLRDES